MAGVASPPPTSTSAQPIPTDTSGQTLPHLPPFTVHFDHLTSSPYHPRITPQERTYDLLIVQKSFTNVPFQSQLTTMTTSIPSPWYPIKGRTPAFQVFLQFSSICSYKKFMIVSYHQLESSLIPPCRPRIRAEKDVETRNSSKVMMVIDGEAHRRFSFHGFLRNAATHVDELSLS